MGKGDKKTKRGKIVIGSYGVRRAKKRNILRGKPKISSDSLPEKKSKLTEAIVKTVIEEQPVVAVQEPVTEIPAVKELPVKKTPKKSVPKKTTEAVEEVAKPKPKVSKPKKKTAGSDKDLFTPDAEKAEK